MKKIATLFIAMMAVCSAYAKDIQELVVSTDPQMYCSNCENKIKGNLRFEKGVKKIVTNLESQTVTVTYDADKTSEEKIAEAFEKLGYQVTKKGQETAEPAEGSTQAGSGCCTKN